MSSSKYPPIAPGTRRFKKIVARIVLFVLGRGLASASRMDSDVANEIEAWPEGFTAMMAIHPAGPCMGVEKSGGRMRYRGSSLPSADLVMEFKNLESAFMVFTAQIGTAKAYAQHRVSVKGHLSDAMVMVRCLNILQAHLFPKLIARHVLKRVPPMGLKKRLTSAYIYLIGIPLGL